MKVLMSSLMKIKSVGEEKIVNHVAYLCNVVYWDICKIVQHCK